MNVKTTILLLWWGIRFCIPIVLIILPKDFFDKGDSYCLSVMLFDIECYGCGMTRAIMHLIHLDYEGAFVFNMLSFIVLPIILFLWGRWLFKDFMRIKKNIYV